MTAQMLDRSEVRIIGLGFLLVLTFALSVSVLATAFHGLRDQDQTLAVEFRMRELPVAGGALSHESEADLQLAGFTPWKVVTRIIMTSLYALAVWLGVCGFLKIRGGVSGRVVDLEGSPLVGVHVLSAKRGLRTVSARDGSFRLTSLSQGTCDLIFNAPRLGQREISVELSLFRMSELGEVIITSE